MSLHRFAFDPAYRAPALAFGVVPRTAWLEVDDEVLRVRYGPWRLTTPLANVASATRSEGYAWLRTAGPPRLSLSDRGVSFTTNRGPGLCLSFHEPVRVLDPTGLLRHPGATVTVEDVDALRAELGLPPT